MKELETHLDNKKLHVIAPPGSGKTILGLEVLLRLNLPTLILSPTITIRNQWVDRLCELFLPVGSVKPDWISKDIRSPKLLTVVTYQALHSVISGKQEKEEEPEEEYNSSNQTVPVSCKSERKALVSKYQALGLGTLVVDECHHLKNEWWRSLTHFAGKINELTLVSLTATPPYDATPAEWDRYKEFCGPVDAEISVPELVQKKDLCPHQDFVLFSEPADGERQVLSGFHAGAEQIFREIRSDREFAKIVLQHRFITDNEKCVSEILDDPAYYSSMLIFLHGVGVSLNEKLFEVLAVSSGETPALTMSWLEILLTGMLYKEPPSDSHQKEKIEQLKVKLKRIGAIERRKITLTSNSTLYNLLSQSVSKLESMSRIVAIEKTSMGNELRLVVLSDYIRKSLLPKSTGDSGRVLKLGVVPIFEYLRTRHKNDTKFGILSGSLVVIPQAAFSSFRNSCNKNGASFENVKTSPWPSDPDYLIIEYFGNSKQKVVKTITKIFEDGYINVLVGTKALLGEGWDSPSINSLILASFVGSFVLSNQMRGRAIRCHQGNQKKVSNIWHLACIDPDSPTGGDDIEMLSRRFSAFLGPSNRDDFIEQGLQRLDLEVMPITNNKISLLNRKMETLAKDRNGTREKWQISLNKGSRLVEEVKTPVNLVPKGFLFTRTIRTLFLQGVYGGGAVISNLFRGLARTSNSRYVWMFIGAALCIGFVTVLPKTIRCLWLYLRNGPVEGAVRQIAHSLLETLKHLGEIKTDNSKLKLVTEYDGQGAVYCSLDGAKYFESSVFRNSLQEILGPIGNPRYLIVRSSQYSFWERRDFHQVPATLGLKKETASTFSDFWKKHVGKNTLIYTRNPEGRKRLVQARGYALSAALAEKSEIVCKWK
ncbi:DEAD/DEAH box helicase [Chitinispirillum alkaliphilum]|nr:DEAD/DEAH box helicase [Chitinispirillum alkaliphilum]